MRKRLRILTLIVLAGLAFLTGLGRRDIVTSHEARVAQTARQMAVAGWPWQGPRVEVPQVALGKTADGITRLEPQWDKPRMAVNPWLVPVLNGEIRLQKPPLPYWCAAVLYRLGHAPGSEGLARLTPALLGALATFLMHSLALRLYGRLVAWCAALVWVSTYFAAEQYRLAMADPYLSFFTLLALWAWVEAWFRTQRRIGFIVLFYAAVGLGLLAKGPPLFLVLGVPIALFPVYFRRKNKPRAEAASDVQGPSNLLAHLDGVALLLILVVPWLVYVFGHVPNVMQMWKYESVGELTGENTEKARAFWFYVPAVFYIGLPWVPLWIVGLAWPWMRRRVTPQRRKRLVFPLVWCAIVVLVFSISAVKKNTYLVPVVPASVLIIAQPLAGLLAMIRRRVRDAMILAWVQAGIGIGVAIAMVVLVVARVTTEKPLAIGAAALCLASACGAVAELRVRKPVLWVWRQTIAYVLALVTILAFLKVDDDGQRSAKDFCQEVLGISNRTGEPLALEKLPEEASLYLPLNVAKPELRGAVLVIVDHPKKAPHEDAKTLADHATGGRIVSVERVPMKSASNEDARWRLYRLRVE